VGACHKSLVKSLISPTCKASSVSSAEEKESSQVSGAAVPASVKLAISAVFASLIAVGTILSIPVPAPLYEITWSPAVYLALSALSDRWTAFSATALGGFIGEAYNVAFKGGGSPIYPFGIVWARGPEVFIVAWAAKKGTRWLVASMIVATVFETVAFYVSDGLFYTYGLFQYQNAGNLSAGFGLAFSDVFTLIDLAYIPIAIAIIYAARPAFRRLGFR
jgi:hypothetical protein